MPRLSRIAQIVFLISVVVVLVFLAPKFVSGVAAVYGSRGMWAMLCITILSMFTGWLLGGPLPENRRVLGIGTTLRNIGLASVIATTNFRDARHRGRYGVPLVSVPHRDGLRHLLHPQDEAGSRMTPLILSQFGFWTLALVDYISLIAATTNAFNGALLARRPDHYKHFTVVGIIILAYAGGIGGGIVRDVLVNKVPSPLKTRGT